MSYLTIFNYGIIPSQSNLKYINIKNNMIIILPVTKIENINLPEVTGLNFLQEPDFL
jgi:hypothetical protein